MEEIIFSSIRYTTAENFHHTVLVIPRFPPRKILHLYLVQYYRRGDIKNNIKRNKLLLQLATTTVVSLMSPRFLAQRPRRQVTLVFRSKRLL